MDSTGLKQATVTARDMANALRALAMDAVEKAKSGHPGMPMGMADVATVLFTKFLTFDPRDPAWPDRDRFVLSAGHGSMLLYGLLHLTGYEAWPLETLKNFRQWGSHAAGHPEYEVGEDNGIETTTGPLGQGLATAVGMALAERMLNEEFGDDLVDHYTYVIAGDGCLMEGISHEAASLAGHLKLNRLIVLFDDNHISIDGPTDLAVSDDHALRFQSYGWNTLKANGHDPDDVARAITAARQSDKPTLIACRTTIGFGAPKKAGTAASHGSPLGAEEIAGAREKLGWPYPPFEIPQPIREAWLQAGARHYQTADSWKKRLGSHPRHVEFERRVTQTGIAGSARDALHQAKKKFLYEAPKLATRQSSQYVLEAIMPHLPELVGGSADLTGSNNTKTKDLPVVKAGSYGGRYIHYGVRELGMAAAMNGLALHGGFVPYGGTFLVFTDYARPAMRLSALMGTRVIYVMTHDSIGLGEDGPTHQPIEHLASLRAMPDLLVFRPADTVETLECWWAALHHQLPSVIALSRQALPALRTDANEPDDNRCLRGGYVLSEAKATRRATILATGSEVSIAIEAQKMLAAEQIDVAVVSLPCWELFDQQPDAYRQVVLGTAPRISIEAASTFGWDRYVGLDGVKIGLDHFGASAPAEELYNQFGLTADAIIGAVKSRL